MTGAVDNNSSIGSRLWLDDGIVQRLQSLFLLATSRLKSAAFAPKRSKSVGPVDYRLREIPEATRWDIVFYAVLR